MPQFQIGRNDISHDIALFSEGIIGRPIATPKIYDGCSIRRARQPRKEGGALAAVEYTAKYPLVNAGDGSRRPISNFL